LWHAVQACTEGITILFNPMTVASQSFPLFNF
jgi:hypothetical protein